MKKLLALLILLPLSSKAFAEDFQENRNWLHERWEVFQQTSDSPAAPNSLVRLHN